MFRTLRITLLSLMTAAIVLPLVNSSTVSAEDGWESIFDGKTLEKWDGNPDFWSVRDGAITGQTTAEKPTKGNTFIIWRGGEVADFELKLQYEVVTVSGTLVVTARMGSRRRCRCFWMVTRHRLWLIAWRFRI